MIKQIRASYSNNKKNAQYCALSTDNLPNYLKNGDEVYFIDTGKSYIYNEQTGELVEGTLSGGGGGGGASSLAGLSDVYITNPQLGQVLKLSPGSGTGTNLKWRNHSLVIDDITDITRHNIIGAALIYTRNGYAFEMLPCFEAYAMDDSSAESLIQVLTMLKSSAKSSGKSGVKIPFPLASVLITLINNIPDSQKKMPMLTIGQYTFNLQSRYSTTMMAFAGTDIDADGVYDISFILDGSAEVGYITVGYTACPAMS